VSAARVLLVDDLDLVRAGFRALLRGVEGVIVVGEAGDGHEALRLIAEQKPDVVLLDIEMPGPNGLEVARQTAKDYPATRLIILTIHDTEDYVVRALHEGAAGYVLKHAKEEELEEAIRAVMRGETYLCPRISQRLAKDYLTRAGAITPSGSGVLTPRQREVLHLMAEGLSTKAIASQLDVSVKTVESHRSQLMDRLNIHDVVGLVKYAIRNGLVGP
jgi:DNA-binding NarL/FixJ family response regulator